MAKKKSAKALKAKKSALEPKDLVPAEYNPRVMSEEAMLGLQASMKEFEDISGITWNQRTKNIVTGHHRWQNIVDAYGLENITFKEISPKRFAILTEGGEDTTFVLRVVDWDEIKEKAANVAANSPTLAGTFTADLASILEDIQGTLDDTLFEALRFDDLLLGVDDVLTGSSGEDWESNITDVEKVEANLDGIITTIRIDCPQELRSDIFTLLQKTLSSSQYSDKAKIK